LKCGHVCKKFCHSYDSEHEKVTCTNKCGKTIETCGHVCQKNCSHSDECKKNCRIIVEKTIGECGHKISIKCCLEPSKSMCQMGCNQILGCGHKCLRKCGIIPCGDCLFKFNSKSLCKHSVNKESMIKVKCDDFNSNKIWKYQTLCELKCNHELDCGHLCSSTCSKCYGGYLHEDCKEKCDRILICGHKCTFPCSKQCRPCMNKCKNQCKHSKCKKKCCEPCDPCMEDCSWKCQHKRCNRKCNEICDREICEEACPKKIKKCGHPCIGVCGEPCPKLCRICHKEEVTEIFFGI
jgi:hypothetical protein